MRLRTAVFTTARSLLHPVAWLMAMIEPQVEAIKTGWLLKRIGADTSVTIRRNVIILHPEQLRLGKNVLLNHNVHISAGGGVTIGDNVVIGAGTMILTTNHISPNFFGNIEHSPISIGSNVWLGAGSVILPGVTISDDIIVAACAVVTKDLDRPGVYRGIPAQFHSPLQKV